MRPVFRPFEMLRNEFDDLFGRLTTDWNGSQWMADAFRAACDVSESADAFEVRMDVPGFKPDDITVEVTGEMVHVHGERADEKNEENGKTFHRVERRRGSFAESVRLPGTVDDAKVRADFQDGVLTITLPKSEACKTRTVKVNAKQK
jgi:HSP20 family protein